MLQDSLTWINQEKWWMFKEENMESLLDYQYDVAPLRPIDQRESISVDDNCFRWDLKELNADMFSATVIARCWVMDGQKDRVSAAKMTYQLRSVIINACNNAAPKIQETHKPQVYWWTPHLEDLRAKSIRCRKMLSKANKGNKKERDLEKILVAKQEYSVARAEYCEEISKAKGVVWEQLIENLDRDPWGRPYKMVLERMHKTIPLTMETMSKEKVISILDKFFPVGTYKESQVSVELVPSWMVEWDVSTDEVIKALKEKKANNTALDSDGLFEKIWDISHDLIELAAKTFTECLRQGKFPKSWKTATLVLIPKVVDPGKVPKYRPICFMQETVLPDVGKTLEWIIMNRIKEALVCPEGSNLSETQFGFRESRSTTDALMEVKNYIQQALVDKEYAVAVRLNIENAFGTLPSDTIIQQLIRKKIPDYLVCIVKDYLSERVIRCRSNDGIRHTRAIKAGIPQSVLGPLLWIITYDWVLEAELDPGCKILCYEDDTLILTRGRILKTAVTKATLCAGAVMERIKELGLQIAAQKTEAVMFHQNSSLPYSLEIQIGEVLIPVLDTIKYLGIVLDSRLTFKAHFEYIENKVCKILRIMKGLMPNLKGSESKKRLYINIIHSVILYAAPVWSEQFGKFETEKDIPFQKIQWDMALRVISANEIVSYEAAMVLARIPPIHLLVECQYRMYMSVKELRGKGELTAETFKELKAKEEQHIYGLWKNLLDNPGLPDKRVREAILPIFEEWVLHKDGEFTYYLTQLMTGHGFFGDYLCRIGRLPNSECAHCGDPNDTAEHTMEECPRWSKERKELQVMVGHSLTWKSLIPQMMACPIKWRAVLTYTKSVMSAKEEAEKAMQRLEKH